MKEFTAEHAKMLSLGVLAMFATAFVIEAEKREEHEKQSEKNKRKYARKKVKNEHRTPV